ncbi:hypothetical protein QQF64_026497 [Cirrhinus molitorella]|uniref:Uncharacterized protein n=1 Tax=Cirrhinus molitorella TaxID=172907 RepID=A0ABR3NA89_9TELE
MRARGRRRIAPYLLYRSTPPVPGPSPDLSEFGTRNGVGPPFTTTAASPSRLNQTEEGTNFTRRGVSKLRSHGEKRTAEI